MFKYILIFTMLTLNYSHSREKEFHHYKREVEVPEPMFIDLVRSLNSQKGEWEINSLFADYHKKADALNWAPEVEYVFKDGHAIEFELPSQGQHLKKYKFAYQTTLSSLENHGHLHGVQVIYETDDQLRESESTFYHIFAKRLSHHISMISLAGIKINNEQLSQRSLSLNHTTFYNYTNEVDFGLEINFETSELHNKMFQAIPQIHLALNHGLKIQYGFGTVRVNGENSLITSFRLIREFNIL